VHETFKFALYSAEFPALVVKASGLAAGKGVVVAKNEDEACQAAIDMLQVANFCKCILSLQPLNPP